MSRFQTQTVILHNVTEQFPLMNLKFENIKKKQLTLEATNTKVVKIIEIK